MKYKVLNCQGGKHFKICLQPMKMSHISRYKSRYFTILYNLSGGGNLQFIISIKSACECTFRHGLLSEVIRGRDYSTGTITCPSTDALVNEVLRHCSQLLPYSPQALFCSPNGFSQFIVILSLYFLLTASIDNFRTDQQIP